MDGGLIEVSYTHVSQRRRRIIRGVAALHRGGASLAITLTNARRGEASFSNLPYMCTDPTTFNLKTRRSRRPRRRNSCTTRNSSGSSSSPRRAAGGSEKNKKESGTMGTDSRAQGGPAIWGGLDASAAGKV